MTDRFMEASTHVSKVVRQPAAWLSTAPISVRSVLTTAQHTLTILGISTSALIALLAARPELAKQFTQNLVNQPALVSTPHAPAPMTVAASALTPALALTPINAEQKNLLNTKKQQQWVTSWLSKRYRVAGDAVNMLVSTTYLTAREIKLDPLLILAVMAIESGLNPFAESPVGAQGLMQVMSKIHHEKFQNLGGVQAALNPAANIRVGSLILKDYVTRGGSIEAGLKTYVGAAAFDTDAGYGSRVLAEYRRLKQVSNGKSVPTSTPVLAAVTPAPAKVMAPAAIKLVKEEEIAGV